MTVRSGGVELVSEYRKSELTEAQIELLRNPPEKKPSGIILCGRFRHPSHPCKCSSKALPGGLRSKKAAAAPFVGREWMKKKAEEEKAKEQAAEAAFRSLPVNIQTVFEHEAEKYEKLLSEMSERIEDLESAVSDLEAEIEELREE